MKSYLKISDRMLKQLRVHNYPALSKFTDNHTFMWDEYAVLFFDLFDNTLDFVDHIKSYNNALGNNIRVFEIEDFEDGELIEGTNLSDLLAEMWIKEKKRNKDDEA